MSEEKNNNVSSSAVENKTESKKKQITVTVINPLRAVKYGVNVRRGITKSLPATIAKKAIKNKDAKEV